VREQGRSRTNDPTPKNDPSLAHGKREAPAKARSRSLVVFPHEDMRENFLLMTATRNDHKSPRAGKKRRALGYKGLVPVATSPDC